MNTLSLMNSSVRLGFRRFVLSLGSLMLLVSSGSMALTSTALADTKPASGTVATVSADPLPTVQINGIVWDQVLVGNKVYAVGSFSTARPAGAAPGTNTVTRQNILAYDITTGVLDTSFVHSLTGAPDTRAGQTVAASPDGTRLYVGGSFTAVDGQARSHFAAFDLTSNKLLPGFSGTDRTVWAIAATNSRVYIGGQFSQAAGQPRASLAAYLSNGALDTAWRADVTGKTGSYVRALVAAEPDGNLIIGGTFSKINGSTYYSTGAVKLTTGKTVKWASQSKKYAITMQAPEGVSAGSTAITSLSFAGKQAYFTAFTFIQGGVKHPGTFEGRAAIDPSNGKIIWANFCKGDSYDAVPIGDVLYSVSHAHNCSAIGAFADTTPQVNQPMRAMAETTKRSSHKKSGIYYSTLLNWFPRLNAGNVSGASQAAWSVVGNSQYIALGGEFTQANGVGQQGLVRYTVASNAPNKVGPTGFSGAGYGVSASPANSKGRSTVRIYNASDQDNSKLTYELYRSGSTQLLASKTVDSRWWKNASWTYTDTGIKPGTSLTYTVVIKDGYGNAKTVTDATLIDNTDSRIKYGGTWTKSTGRSDKYPDFGRSLSYTKKNGSSATMTFTGSSITLFVEKGYDFAQATVSIDGGAPTQIDTSYYDGNTSHKNYRRFQQQAFSVSGLSAGTHTIKITKTSGTYLMIDAFKVR